jgi:tRNA dimethylallyltransferase
MKTPCKILKRLIVIAGPTASGKTTLALQLAKALHAEIINADSRQFYRQLNIGTAKPSQAEMNEVPHHFINIKNPEEYYSAGEFEKDSISFLDSYFESNNTAIIVGGSGLYLKAVLEGFDDLPRDEVVRAKLNLKLKGEGLESLQSYLVKQDPVFAGTEDFNNPQRVVRALEVMELTGKRWTDLRTNKTQERNFTSYSFYLNPERQWLYQKISERVDNMINNGLEDEVKSLISFRSHNALQTVGYKECFDLFDGIYNRNEAIDKIKQHTRNYAKRQITWFKKQKGFIAIENDAFANILKHLNKTSSV